MPVDVPKSPMGSIRSYPHRQPKESQGRRTRAVTKDLNGRYVRPAMTPAGSPDLALDATLRSAAPYQKVRNKGNLPVAIA